MTTARSILAALSEIAPGESCMFSLRIFKHGDGRLDPPRMAVTTDSRTWVSDSLDGLVEMATEGREASVADEILKELETVQ